MLPIKLPILDRDVGSVVMVVYEGEVAVLVFQGKLELWVYWHHILVCCRDLYYQLECERWGMIGVVLGV